MSVVDGSFDHTLEPEESAAGPLMGGFMNYGYQCGMLWGATLAAGAEAYQRYGTGSGAETAAMLAAEKLVETFRARNKNECNCLEITEMNFRGKNGAFPKKFLLKGGPLYCFLLSAGYAKEAADDIDTALSKNPMEAHACPTSCTAMLIQRMGGSDMHAVMAAGYAGGIGLSGGACGALGAAIWMLGMNCIEEGVGDQLWDSEVFQSWAADMIDRFISTAGEFECTEIVGRGFENIDDHASYLRDGGCSEVIEALTTQL